MFRLAGDTRTVAFDGVTVLLRDLKGMRYLTRLLAEPGRAFHVLDLVGAEAGVGPDLPTGAVREVATSNRDAGPVLDPQAKEAYRRRLRDIEEDLEQTVATGTYCSYLPDPRVPIVWEV